MPEPVAADQCGQRDAALRAFLGVRERWLSEARRGRVRALLEDLREAADARLVAGPVSSNDSASGNRSGRRSPIARANCADIPRAADVSSAATGLSTCSQRGAARRPAPGPLRLHARNRTAENRQTARTRLALSDKRPRHAGADDPGHATADQSRPPVPPDLARALPRVLPRARNRAARPERAPMTGRAPTPCWSKWHCRSSTSPKPNDGSATASASGPRAARDG